MCDKTTKINSVIKKYPDLIEVSKIGDVNNAKIHIYTLMGPAHSETLKKRKTQTVVLKVLTTDQ